MNNASSDLNDPNNTIFEEGIIGNDSKYALRVPGSYLAPYGITVAGSLVSNQGYPFVSTFAVNRALALQQAGVALTRASDCGA